MQLNFCAAAHFRYQLTQHTKENKQNKKSKPDNNGNGDGNDDQGSATDDSRKQVCQLQRFAKGRRGRVMRGAQGSGRLD